MSDIIGAAAVSSPPAPPTPAVRDVVDQTDPRAEIWNLIRGQWRFCALYAFVDLDLAGWLGEGRLGLTELAGRADLDRDALGRLLRTAGSLGLVSTRLAPDGEPSYELSSAGATLRGDIAQSMRSVVIPQGAPHFVEAMGALAEAARNGKSPFAARYGSLYTYLEGHPEARVHFDAHMATRSQAVADVTVAAYDFSGIEVLADIGGGVGTVLAKVLQATPGLRGLLFELEPVLPGARERLAAAGVLDRCRLVSGDFFTAVPQADAYLLSNIVHNWNDADVLRILGNVRGGVPDGGRVLFLDMLLPDDDQAHLGKELDMRMLALYDGARERTRTDYLALLSAAGLEPVRVLDLPNALSLVEARPR